MGVTNELGEFPTPGDAESRRPEVYAGLSGIDPRTAAGPEVSIPPRIGPRRAVCRHCGETFEKKRSDQEFCSVKCRKADYGRRRREKDRHGREGL